jgi:hypothetical protein
MDDYFNDDASVGGMSVGSLAVPESEADGVSSMGGTRTQVADADEDEEVLAVNRENRNLYAMKFFMVVLLGGGGLFLSLASYHNDQTTSKELGEPSNAPLHIGVVGGIFALLLIVFLRYDHLVTLRQSFVMDMAKKSKQIVNSLFPSVVRDRLMLQSGGLRHESNHSARSEDDPFPMVDLEKLTKLNTAANKNISEMAPIPITIKPKALSVPALLAQSTEMTQNDPTSKPIADLFPNSTIFFADIVGFTAWSAERDPPQVFTLLENVYSEFDKLAEKLNVFKVRK